MVYKANRKCGYCGKVTSFNGRKFFCDSCGRKYLDKVNGECVNYEHF